MNVIIACAIAIATASPSPAPLQGGTSFADAVVIKAPNEDAGVAAEYAYLRAHPCNGGSWRIKQQRLLTHDGVPYDVLAVACTTGDAQREYFFDISSYFGKF